MRKPEELKFKSVFSIGVSSESNVVDIPPVLVKDYSGLDTYFNEDFGVDHEDVIRELDELRGQFNNNTANLFFKQQKDKMINIVTDKFLLGGVMAKNDKVGGSVDTIQNVRKGVFTDSFSSEIKTHFENNKYDSDQYHKHKNYIAKGRSDKKLQSSGELHDAYRNKKMGVNESRNLDHVKPAVEIHYDPGAFLAEKNTVELANKDSNLQSTTGFINKTKGAKPILKSTHLYNEKKGEHDKVYFHTRDSSIKNKTDRITKYKKELESMIKVTPEQKHSARVLEKKIENGYRDLDEINSINNESMRELDRISNKEYEKEINKYYKSSKFIKSTISESANQATAMGIRQVVGVFLTEVISSIFDEIKDLINNGVDFTESVLNDLKNRIDRTFNRLKNKWEEALDAGLQGATSGFLSSIATVFINIFMTTAKNIVRIIREGFFAIIKAIKYITSPPTGFTKEEVFHEAGKIIISGIVIAVAILFEEAIDKTPPMLIIRGIPVIGEYVADIIYGFMAALAAGLAVWGWDKLDLFGVNRKSQHDFVMLAIKSKNDEVINSREKWLEDIRVKDPKRYSFLKAEFLL